jgi:hypothetical protein
VNCEPNRLALGRLSIGGSRKKFCKICIGVLLFEKATKIIQNICPLPHVLNVQINIPSKDHFEKKVTKIPWKRERERHNNIAQYRAVQFQFYYSIIYKTSYNKFS